MSFEKFLKEQIEKTGYPLEIEISSILDDDSWDVINTDSYFDKDEGKLRDIDILASKDFGRLFPVVANANLVIECKKNENFAWVFFTRPFKFDYINDITGQYMDELQARTKKFENFQIMEVIFENCDFHYHKMNRVAVSFDEIPIKGKKSTFDKEKRQIFEAENQLKKHITYSNEQFWKSPVQEARFIMIDFPCIVFDGLMYEASLKKGKLKLKKSEHVLLTTSNKASYYHYDVTFLINVVTKDYFKIFLQEINNDVKSFFDLIKKRKRKVNRELSIIERIS